MPTRSNTPGQARPSGMTQAALVFLLQALRDRVFRAPVLAMGTTTTRIKTTNDTDFCINGTVYKKAATDNIQVTGLTNTAAGQFRKVRVEINTAGTVSFKEGAVGTTQGVATMPNRSTGKATLGYIEIPASFTYGTTDFNATGVAFFDADPDLDANQLEAPA